MATRTTSTSSSTSGLVGGVTGSTSRTNGIASTASTLSRTTATTTTNAAATTTTTFIPVSSVTSALPVPLSSTTVVLSNPSQNQGGSSGAQIQGDTSLGMGIYALIACGVLLFLVLIGCTISKCRKVTMKRRTTNAGVLEKLPWVGPDAPSRVSLQGPQMQPLNRPPSFIGSASDAASVRTIPVKRGSAHNLKDEVYDHRVLPSSTATNFSSPQSQPSTLNSLLGYSSSTSPLSLDSADSSSQSHTVSVEVVVAPPLSAEEIEALELRAKHKQDIFGFSK
ncbi:hypothetical protein BDR26DRAFT_859097 [Obelidium mucronatum]|nr:hypothetical protein BDR26DRAFT_859097 [Obelidium mucronatum]